MNIKHKDWKTGEEREYHSSDPINETGLICPFDNVQILDRSYYHNEHDVFCPGCGANYLRNSTQEEINEQAKESILKRKKDLIRLEKTKEDLEARIKHAEEMGLISK